jgi:hypothetical protein
MKDLRITEIRLFATQNDDGTENRDVFSAEVIINDRYMIQYGTDEEFSIPNGNLACWSHLDEDDETATEIQDEFAEKYGESETLEKLIKKLKIIEAIQRAVDKDIFE